MKFTRITVNPKQMDGMPCIRGLRIPVATVVGMVAEGMTQAQILKAYPDLEAADINEALQYAGEAVMTRCMCGITDCRRRMMSKSLPAPLVRKGSSCLRIPTSAPSLR